MGGFLLTQYYNVYAQYLAKYIVMMKSYGIHIDAITLQNEPENDKNNPSLLMNAIEQTNFIKNNVGPVFHQQNIKTKIVFIANPNNPTGTYLAKSEMLNLRKISFAQNIQKNLLTKKVKAKKKITINGIIFFN